MFAASKTDSVSGETPDPQFNYVTMLLHGDGTNGAQNNTFLDSSTNNFTITRNGNTTQGSFSPYGSNWSNFFNGAADPNTDRLRITNTSALNLGSGDFTVECWWFSSKALNAYTVEYAFLFGKGNSIDAGTWSLGIYQSKIYFATNAFTLQGSTNVTANSWNHFAATRSGSTVRVFTNGVLNGSTTSSQDITSSATFNIGDRQPSDPSANYPFNGYISNVRVVVGSALYTSNFTPSTTPLTAVSGTALLTCADNRFVDDSTNNYAITINGTPSVQRFNPFGTSTAYSTSVIGGSGYFDGTGDRLTAPDSTAFDLGSGDFTIEGWVYQTANNNLGAGFVIQWTTTGSLAWYFGTTTTNQFAFAWTTNGSTIQSIVNSSTVTLNTWVHYAATRSGTTGRIFVNGVEVATGTISGTIFNSSDVVTIGNNPNSGSGNWHLSGYMTDARVVKGTALYTSAFTPPTAPLTAVTNTSLLLNYTNGAIFDNAMMNDLETVGNAQISTSVVKYGTGSMAFDGTGDYLVSAPSPDNILGGGDFTIEFWLYPNNTSGSYRALVSSENYNPSVTGGWSLYQNGTSFEFWISSGNIINATSAITAGVWQHLALSRASGTLRLFINGTQVTSVSNTTSLTGQKILIGDNLGSYFYNGYLDDIRITKGYARYTATFTPPTAAFPNIGPY
jgi:hypothetical protein